MKAWRWICLVAFVVLANYCYFPWLGLYEDDFCVLSRYTDLDLPLCWESSRDIVFRFKQGRPLSFLVPVWLGVLGWKLGALGSFYWFSAAIVACNAALMVRLSLKIWNSSHFATIASILLLLFAADKIRLSPHAVFIVQGALGLFLLSCHGLLSRRWAPLAYLGVLAGMMLYELFFPQIILFPLLIPPERRGIGLKRHWCICAFLGLICLAARKATGEQRVEQLMAGDLFHHMVFNTVCGPPISLLTFATCLRDGLYWVATNPVFAVAALMLLLVCLPGQDDGESSDRPKPTRLLGGCLLLLFCGYSLALTTWVNVVVGRETRAHSAAAFPWALALSYLWTSTRTRLSSGVWRGITLAYLLALFGKNVALQRTYAECWEKQQVLWTELLRVWPRSQPGQQDVILLFTMDLPPTQEMDVAPWSLFLISEQLVRAPDRKPPMIIRTRSRKQGFTTMSELVSRFNFYWLGVPETPRFFMARPEGNHFRLFRPQLQGDLILGWQPVEPGPPEDWEKLPLYYKLIVSDTTGLSSPFKP